MDHDLTYHVVAYQHPATHQHDMQTVNATKIGETSQSTTPNNPTPSSSTTPTSQTVPNLTNHTTVTHPERPGTGCLWSMSWHGAHWWLCPRCRRESTTARHTSVCTRTCCEWTWPCGGTCCRGARVRHHATWWLHHAAVWACLREPWASWHLSWTWKSCRCHTKAWSGPSSNTRAIPRWHGGCGWLCWDSHTSWRPTCHGYATRHHTRE